MPTKKRRSSIGNREPYDSVVNSSGSSNSSVVSDSAVVDSGQNGQSAQDDATERWNYAFLLTSYFE